MMECNRENLGSERTRERCLDGCICLYYVDVCTGDSSHKELLDTLLPAAGKVARRFERVSSVVSRRGQGRFLQQERRGAKDDH